MRSRLMVPVLLALLAPAPIHAQRLPAPLPTLHAQPGRAPQALPQGGRWRSPVGAMVGGLVGGTAGLIGGAMVGAGMEGPCNCDDPGLVGAIYGGLVGEAVGLALGTHLGNGLRGNLALDLVASAAGSLTSVALVSGAGDGPVLIPAVALQVALVVGTELGIARQKARDR